MSISLPYEEMAYLRDVARVAGRPLSLAVRALLHWAISEARRRRRELPQEEIPHRDPDRSGG